MSKLPGSALGMIAMALAATVYLAYGVFDFSFGEKTIRLTVELPSSGGLMQTSPVTLNGLQIGRVRTLAKSEHGITAELAVQARHRIPVDSTVTVANLSAVGEQYLDFAPKTAAGPYLSDGSRVSGDRVVQPLTIARSLGGIQGVLSQIRADDINAILAGADVAVADVGPSIEKLVRSGSMFATTLRQNRELIQRVLGFLSSAAAESSGDQLELSRAAAERLGRTLGAELPVLLDEVIGVVESSGGTEVIPFIPLAQRIIRYLTVLIGKGGPALEVLRPILFDPLEGIDLDVNKTMDALLAAFPDGKGFRVLVDIPR
ncbi:MlaD family protein [Nocardia sp. NPDC051756]|uniref:MlaD family protein n=1 Tax=Nocardia sp. NPDC051756 TaxID=3154751 RepID=UPI0034281FB7